MAKRRIFGGYLILAMMVVTIIGGILGLYQTNSLLTLAGIASWMAAGLLWVDLLRAQKIQVGLLILIGLFLALIGVLNGASMDIQTIVTGNTGLLTMVTSVGFLRLVAMPGPQADQATIKQHQSLPAGHSGFVQTIFGTAIFGAVINISAPILIADRIHDQRPLARFTSQTLTRVFSAAASWSPFFAGMAVVLTFVPEADLAWLMAAGLPFALVSLALVYAEARLRYSGEIDGFVGYPLRLSSLWIPGLLALFVLLSQWLIEDLPILITIASGSLSITGVVLWQRIGAFDTIKALGDHVRHGLPRVVNELTLFLAAGVLASGIRALIDADLLLIGIDGFDAISAIALVGLMILFGAMGVHPVILISGFTPLLIALDPNPNLLALCYLFAWSMGTCASPLSGTHLVFQGRYGIPSWRGAVWNWPYVIMMYLFSSFWIWMVAN